MKLLVQLSCDLCDNGVQYATEVKILTQKVESADGNAYVEYEIKPVDLPARWSEDTGYGVGPYFRCERHK